MTDVSERKAENSPLKPGARGWLLVFVLWLGVINPVFWIGFNFFIFDRMEDVNPGDAELMQILGWDVLIWVVTIIREGMRIASALALYFYRRPISVWIAFAVLWLSGPLLILCTWVIVGGSEYNVAALVRSALWALGWSLYLFMSQRVRITYAFRARA